MSYLRTIFIQSQVIAKAVPAATRSIHSAAPIRSHSPRGVHTPFAVLGPSHHKNLTYSASSSGIGHHADRPTPSVLANGLHVVSPVQSEAHRDVPRGAFSVAAPYITPEVKNTNAKPKFRSKISGFAHPLSGKN